MQIAGAGASGYKGRYVGPPTFHVYYVADCGCGGEVEAGLGDDLGRCESCGEYWELEGPNGWRKLTNHEMRRNEMAEPRPDLVGTYCECGAPYVLDGDDSGYRCALRD